MVGPYEGYVAVAEELDRLTPGDHEKRTALFNTGVEAVENAVKVARVATGRSAVVVFDHAYHGRTKDRKSTCLNSSHANISYAVFCLKKKKNEITQYNCPNNVCNENFERMYTTVV